MPPPGLVSVCTLPTRPKMFFCLSNLPTKEQGTAVCVWAMAPPWRPPGPTCASASARAAPNCPTDHPYNGCKSRQLDVIMPHDGELEHDELGADPKYVFLPARHPNARDRPSIQLDVDFRRANERYPTTVSVPALRTAPPDLVHPLGTLPRATPTSR